MNSYFAIRVGNKKDSHNSSKFSLSDVTAIIPVYKEDHNIFEKVIESVASLGIDFIVVGDGSLEPYKTITENHHGKFIHISERKGKRYAIAEGIKYVNSPLVMLLDSDTIISKDSLIKLVSSFDDSVGGVSPNIRVFEGDRAKSYATYYAEFFERLSEIINRAVSYFGNSIILSGQCVIYKTNLIKPYVMSKEFLEPRLFGKKIVISDDRDLTDYIIKRGYRALKVYDVFVYTKPPKNIKIFTKQVVRWTRANYLTFLREIIDGSVSKRGTLYVFNSIYTNLLPVFALLFIYMNWDKYLKLLISLKDLTLELYKLIMFLPGHFNSPDLFLHFFIHYGGILAVIPFVLTFIYIIPENKTKVLIYGSVALGVQYIASLYSMLTFWRQDWLTR